MVIAPSVFYYVYFQYQSNLKFEIKRWNLNDRMTLYKTLQNTKGAITNGQSRETGNIVYTKRRKTKQKYNTICMKFEIKRWNLNDRMTLYTVVNFYILFV
jgi:hypothetical protein